MLDISQMEAYIVEHQKSIDTLPQPFSSILCTAVIAEVQATPLNEKGSEYVHEASVILRYLAIKLADHPAGIEIIGKAFKAQ